MKIIYSSHPKELSHTVMSKQLDKEDHERLVEIHEEMHNLLHEASELVRTSGNKFQYDRAKAYWIGHIEVALGGGENYIDRYAVTMKDAIEALEPDEEEDEEVDFDEDEDFDHIHEDRIADLPPEEDTVT